MSQSNLKIASFVALILLVFFSGIYFFRSNISLITSTGEKTISKPPLMEVYAWYPDYDEQNALASLKTAKITQVSPFWYMLDESGKLIIDESETKDEVLTVAKERKIAILPSIVNEFDGERVHKLLIAKYKWASFSEQLISLAQQEGYKGYDLDLEELLASDRNNYVEFTSYLASQFHKNNLILSITVHAQTGDPDPRDAEVAQDLAQLSKSADQIRVMAYDFHHADSEPGPVTPLGDLQKVLDTTKKLVPLDKVVISLPTYGYDWSVKHGEDLQYADAMKLIKEKNVNYHLDEKEEALTGTYQGDDGKHVIWFENSQTLKAKLAMVKKAGFYKISLWRLGGEDPLTWNTF
jgi:spore germination protein YaaH